MATSGKPLSEQDQQRIVKLRASGLSIRRLAEAERISTRTVQKYLKSNESSRQSS